MTSALFFFSSPHQSFYGIQNAPKNKACLTNIAILVKVFYWMIFFSELLSKETIPEYIASPTHTASCSEEPVLPSYPKQFYYVGNTMEVW